MAYNAGASSGNLVLISSQVASASSALTFTSGITGYLNYLLTYTGVVVSNNNATLYARLSSNGGSSYIATGYENAGVVSTTTGIFQFVNNTTTQIQLMDGILTGAGLAANGQCTLYGLNSSTLYKNFYYTSGYRIGFDSSFSYKSAAGELADTTSMNALQVTIDAGTFSGTFKLYGVRN